MKNIYCFALLAVLFACNGPEAVPPQQDIQVEQLNQVLNIRDTSTYTYQTKFGDVKFIRHDGKLGTPAEKIILNDKILISTEGQTGAQGASVSLMTEIMTSSSTEYVPRRPGKTGIAEIRRMVVLLGGDLNCIKKFIILDFSSEKPFVSEKFGKNPNDELCLTFKGAKWGKKESEIILNGPRNYTYYTLDKIMGPFVYE